MNPRFVIFKGTDGQYYWRLVAENGEILCHSEGYASKQGAQNGIYSCKRIVPIAQVHDNTVLSSIR